mmetsp:Transcript_27281/g.84115  ORF Transcript_27281/g.84115 Transcript_27281/m.84115 type:complete len:164 (-) Transcript_27281:279-770(-)
MLCTNNRGNNHVCPPERVLATWVHPQSNESIVGVGTSDDMTSYTDDPVLLTFARHFCENILMHERLDLRCRLWCGGSRSSPLGGLPSPIERWCARVLYDCVANDRPAVLPLYIQLHHTSLTLSSIQHQMQAWSVCVAIEYQSWFLLNVQAFIDLAVWLSESDD